MEGGGASCGPPGRAARATPVHALLYFALVRLHRAYATAHGTVADVEGAPLASRFRRLVKAHFRNERLSTPVFVGVAAWLMLGEAPSAWLAPGGALVLSGLAWSLRR